MRASLPVNVRCLLTKQDLTQRPMQCARYPTYATNIPGPPCLVRAQHGACLSTEACCPDQGSRLLSVLIEGRWVSGRRCRIANGWYTTLRQVTASVVGVGYINRRPSSL